MTKSQMAFDLPKLSYIDTRWEEPAVQIEVLPRREHGFASWIAGRVAAFRTWRADMRSLAELNSISDDRFNEDLRGRGRSF
jgi:uncharacterized protein YjiS (DUF1127 family)